MSKSDLKKQKDLFKDLDKLYNKNRQDIIDWLKGTAKEYAEPHNDKITNLLTKSKIQINTTSEYGVYNLILQWFLNNKDKFTDSEELKLFDNIPSTTFTEISKTIMMRASSPRVASSPRAASSQSLSIEEAIKKWKGNSSIDPYNGSEVKTSIVPKSTYAQLYEKFITHLTKKLKPTDIMNPEIFESIRKQLPTNHIYVSEEIDYIKNLKDIYSDDLVENKWIDFLVKEKSLIYSKETILEKKGYTVYDHLFMHFYLIKNKKHFKDYNIKEIYIDNQQFLYETIQNQIKLVKANNMEKLLNETIENQIKLVKANDMDCYEVINSMLKFTSEQNKGINFQVKRTTVSQDEWPYQVPPLLKLFTEYVYEIIYYLMPIQTLNGIIFHDYFLYGNRKTGLDNKKKIEYIDNSINYNKYRLKTIINLIFGSMYNSDNTEKINIKTFLKILWTKVKDIIFEEQKYHTNRRFYHPISDEKVLYLDISKNIGEAEIKNIKLFFVSSIFDIETAHKESQENNNVLYEPVIDPYNNLPEPPKMPRAPVISQDLQRYKMTSHIKGKNSAKERELKEHQKKEKEFKMELKSYDKKLKDYNDKHLDKKLSPYFSVKLSRAKSVINDKNSLRLSYSPLKVSAKSLTNFKSQKQKELLAKFEKEPYSKTYKQKKIASQDIESSDEEIDEETLRIKRFREAKRQRELERQRIERERQQIETERERLVQQGRVQQEREREREIARQERDREIEREEREEGGRDTESARATERLRQELQRMGYWVPNGGGSKTKLSKSDLKLKLALEADNPKFKQYAKLSPSGKSPRQKYVGCDLNSNDPITQETLGDLHFKKIKYLSKIKTTLPDGKIVTNCYDTIPFYNYILDCNNKGETPLNLAIGKVPLTLAQKAEVFKKIKFFTKQPTLELNIDTTKKYFLKGIYIPSTYSSSHYTTYSLRAQINIGSIDFNVIDNNLMRYYSGAPKVLHEGPIISRDDMLFEDTSDETVLLIQKGMENGSLLKVNTYPYWNLNYSSEGNMPYGYKLVSLPPFTFSTNDSIQQLEERTKVFNNRLRRLI
jgi:hypothetical protein